jgi:hypothetical protein
VEKAFRNKLFMVTDTGENLKNKLVMITDTGEDLQK